MLNSLLLSFVLVGGAEPSLASRSEVHLRELASPKYEGRMTLSAGNLATVEYIERTFKSAGLTPRPGQTAFREGFDIGIGERPTRLNLFRIGNHSLAIGVDYVPVLGSVEERMKRGTPVWFGRSMPTGDLTGKIAFLRRESSANGANLGQRVAEVGKLGGAGVVLVGPSAPGRRELPIAVRTQGIASDAKVVGTAMTVDAFKRVFRDVDWDSDTRQELSVPVQMLVDFEPNRGTSFNVVGYLPGTDPALANNPIVIGAHFDHLGYGETSSRSGTDQLHNGADDNASGTAGMLALAEYFAKNRVNRRPIMFQGYSGEEVGLVGSTAWVRANPEVVKNTFAMINMDMIGRLRNERVIVFCVNSSQPFEAILKGITVPGLKPDLVMTSPSNSDHAAFLRAQIPSLFFNTDLHSEYHTEKDTVDTINFDGVSRVLDFVRQTIMKIDERATLPFNPEARVSSGSGGDASSARRVRVGFIPDMAGNDGKPGMTLGGASPGSPAEAAGIKPGDRLISFDGKPINTIEDLQAVLMSAKANVTVDIVILRDGKTLTLKLTPTASS